MKFAKYSTQNNEKNYYLGNVVDYIEETKNGYQPPKTPQPTDTETEESATNAYATYYVGVSMVP